MSERMDRRAVIEDLKASLPQFVGVRLTVEGSGGTGSGDPWISVYLYGDDTEVLAEMARLARSAQIYLEQGYAASRAGRMAEAVAAFRMAVEFNPDDVAARVSLGQGLALSGDHGGAMEQFDRALALDPRHPVAHYWRGTLMEEDGDDAGAAVEFAAALEADPGHVRAGMRLGDALMRLGRYEQAAGAYAGIDLNGGGQALVRYWQGLALFGGGACEQAVPVLEAAFGTTTSILTCSISGISYPFTRRIVLACAPIQR